MATCSCLILRSFAERGVAPEAVAEAYHAFESGDTNVRPLSAAAVSNQSMQESMRLLLMVRAYQVCSFSLSSYALRTVQYIQQAGSWLHAHKTMLPTE